MSIRYELEVEGFSEALVVWECEGVERLHRPWSYDLRVEPPQELVIAFLDELIGASGTLRGSAYGSLDPEGGIARMGLVTAAELTEFGLKITLASRLSILGEAEDYRVFVDRDVVEIVTEILSLRNIAVVSRLSRTPRRRRQCVQCWESTLSFVGRILAEEGLVYFCDHGCRESVVLVDAAIGFTAHDQSPLTLRRGNQLVHDVDRADSVLSATLERKLRPECATEGDFAPECPCVTILDQHGDATSPRERFGFHSRASQNGAEALSAQWRLESIRNDAETLRFETTCRTLFPGMVTEIEGDEAQLNDRWLIVQVDHRGLFADQSCPDKVVSAILECDYQAIVLAVPAKHGYQEPLSLHRAPRSGLQTATVVGPTGVEVHPDSLGRVKSLHRWDRVNRSDDTCSSWHRVVQPALSGGMLIPRVGWDQLTAHWGTGTDEPISLGRLGHALATPPTPLPKDDRWSAVGTSSTPGGGPGNRIAMNDQAGSEGLHLNAGGSMTDKTTKDKSTSIAAVEMHTVSGNRELSTGQVHSVNIGGVQSYTVGSRKVAVDADKAVNAGSELVSIGGTRSFTIGGTQSIVASALTRMVHADKGELCTGGESRIVGGVSTVQVGGLMLQTSSGGYHVGVAGANTEFVAGVKSIRARSAYLLEAAGLVESYGARLISGKGVLFNYGSNLDFTAGGGTFKGANVVFNAASKISIRAGGATITITPGSVTIDGEYKNSSSSTNSGGQDYG